MTKAYRFPAKTCAECGETFGSNRADAEFCSDSCRKRYNNRRAQRGAEIYDMAMNWRFGSGQGRESEAYTILCALLSGYNEEDKASRKGRRSYAKLQTALNGLNRLPSVPDGR